MSIPSSIPTSGVLVPYWNTPKLYHSTIIAMHVVIVLGWNLPKLYHIPIPSFISMPVVLVPGWNAQSQLLFQRVLNDHRVVHILYRVPIPTYPISDILVPRWNTRIVSQSRVAFQCPLYGCMKQHKMRQTQNLFNSQSFMRELRCEWRLRRWVTQITLHFPLHTHRATGRAALQRNSVLWRW